MLYIYYKDKLNYRQNKPFIDYFGKKNKKINIVSNLGEIKINTSNMIYILVGTLEFYEVYFKFLFKKNVKVVYRSRGVAPEESYYRNKSKLRLFILSVIEFFVISLSKHIIVVSNKHKEHYINKYNVNPNKISVIHNYLTKDSYNLKDVKPNKMEIVYVGGLAKWQKIDEVKSLFKKISLRNSEISFLICTNKDNISQAKTMFSDIEKISYESYENYNDLIKRISMCNAGVILRGENKVNECSSPFKIIDYLSAQLPVIMSKNIGDYSELFNDKDFILQLDNLFFSKETIVDIEAFIVNSYQNAEKIKKDMCDYSNLKLDVEPEIEEVMSLVFKL